VTWLMLRVSDTGVGIPAPELEHAFDAFWQGGNVLAGRPKGIGLGLTIARRVIELHGGTITVQSTVGEGTKVTVAIPQSKSRSGQADASSADTRPVGTSPADTNPADTNPADTNPVAGTTAAGPVDSGTAVDGSGSS
jgi:hypothetical protein